MTNEKKTNSIFQSSGFTLIELILVVAIISILALLSGTSLVSFLASNNLEVAGDKIVGAIRKAQSYAMDGKNNTTWGVCMSGNNLLLFSGSCSSPTFSEIYNLPGVNVSGLYEVTFSVITGKRGEPSGALPLTVTLTNDSGTPLVRFNEVGGIEIN